MEMLLSEELSDTSQPGEIRAAACWLAICSGATRVERIDESLRLIAAAHTDSLPPFLKTCAEAFERWQPATRDLFLSGLNELIEQPCEAVVQKEVCGCIAATATAYSPDQALLSWLSIACWKRPAKIMQ